MSKWVRTVLVLTSSVLGGAYAFQVAPAWAQTDSRATTASRFTNVEVVSVDLDSRTVVVRPPDGGETSTFSVGSAVAGLTDLRPGDRIIVGLAADRNANVQQIASIQPSTAPARTAGGTAPAAAVTAAGDLAAQVVKVDPTGRTLTIRVPRHADRTLAVDASVAGLGQLRPGDRIRMTLQNGAAGAPQMVTGIRPMSSSPTGRAAATTPRPSQASAPATAGTTNPRSAPATERPNARAASSTARTAATTPAPATVPGVAAPSTATVPGVAAASAAAVPGVGVPGTGTAPGVVAPGTATGPGVAAPGTAPAPGVAAPGTAPVPGIAAPGTATVPGVAAPGTATGPGVAAPGTASAPGVTAPGTTSPNVTGVNATRTATGVPTAARGAAAPATAAVSGQSSASVAAPTASSSGATTAGAVTAGGGVGAPAGGTSEGPSLAAGLFTTQPVPPVTAPVVDTARLATPAAGASAATNVPDAARLMDTRRQAGARDFSRRLASLAQGADEIDLLWMRYKTACGVEVAPNSTQAREWFTLWEGGGTPVSGSVDCDSYYDELVRHGEALKSQVATAEASAQSAGVEPGTIRSVFDNYRLGWSGWGRASPPLRRR